MIACSISVRYIIGILIGTALNLYFTFGNMAILTILILPIQEHGRSSKVFFNFFLYHVILGSDVLNMTSKAQEIKARINNWDRFKLNSFLSAKETISNAKREPTEWENIFATHTSDRALISRMYKELK